MKYIGVMETFVPENPFWATVDRTRNHTISFRIFKTLKEGRDWAESINYIFAPFSYGPKFENEKPEKIDYQSGKVYKNGHDITIIYLIPEKKLDSFEFKINFKLDF